MKSSLVISLMCDTPDHNGGTFKRGGIAAHSYINRAVSVQNSALGCGLAHFSRHITTNRLTLNWKSGAHGGK
jgi:hypothetical protein